MLSNANHICNKQLPGRLFLAIKLFSEFSNSVSTSLGYVKYSSFVRLNTMMSSMTIRLLRALWLILCIQEGKGGCLDVEALKLAGIGLLVWTLER